MGGPEDAGVLELGRDLIDPIDEGKGSDPRKLLVHGVEEREREGGELGDRARHIAEEEQFRARAPWKPEGRFEGHAAGAERAAHRPPDIELAAAPEPALPRASAGQLARERPDRFPHGVELRRRGAQEVDVLEQAGVVAGGGVVDALDLAEPVPDRFGEELAEVVDPAVLFIPIEAAFERAVGLCLAGGGRSRHEVGKIQLPKHPIQVIPARRRAVEVDAGVEFDGHCRERAQFGLIVALQGLEKPVEEGGGIILAVGVRLQPIEGCRDRSGARLRVRVRARRRHRAAESEAKVEERLEGGFVLSPLDQRRRQGRAELRAVGEVDLAERLHRVDRLDHGHRDSGQSQSADEVEDRRDNRAARAIRKGRSGCALYVHWSSCRTF